MRVHTGLTDGQQTEVTGPADLKQGLQIIAAVTGGETAAAPAASSNPFQPNNGGGRGGPGRGF
jgi:hypothetical protein